jgi:hypothetical protein
MEPGRSERLDFEYRRGGMAYVSMAFEPLTDWREIGVGERRRKQEFAQEVRHLAEETYLSAEKIRLVVDNLSTHTPAAFLGDLPTRGCPPLGQESGVRLHASARLVAEHGRD